MSPEIRHATVGLSIDALIQQWAREQAAPAGSAYVVDSEIAARRRGGVLWWHRSDATAVAVVARPERLDPGSADLLWLAASLGAAEAFDRVTGESHRCSWPDGIIVESATGDVDVAITSAVTLGPGRVDHGMLVVRVANVSMLAGARDVSESLVRSLRRSVDLLDEPEQLVHDYTARCDTLGKRVSVSQLPRGTIRGVASTISATGSLVITSTTGLAEAVPVATLHDVMVIDPAT